MKQLPTACPLGEAEVEEVRRVEPFEIDVELPERQDEDLKEDPTELDVVGGEQRFVAEDDVNDVLEGHAEAIPLSVLRRCHVGDGVDEKRRAVERRGRSLRIGAGSTFDGEPRDGRHRFEEAPDNVVVVGEQHVAESFQDERGDVDEIHVGGDEVRREFIGDQLVANQLCDSPVALVDRRDKAQVDIDVQLLRVEVVRLAVVVVVHLAHDEDGVVTVLTTKSSDSRMKQDYERGSAQSSMLVSWVLKGR